MSLRDKARQLRSEAEASRGIYQPGADSRSFKIYRWWQRETDSNRSKENFCHFYRVVLIWAPLRFVGKFLERRVLFPLWAWLGIVGLLSLYTGLHLVYGWAWLSMLVNTAFIVGGAMLFFLNAAWLIMFVERVDKKQWGSFYQHNQMTYVLLLPVAGIVTGLVILVMLPIIWLAEIITLAEKGGIFKKIWAWMCGKRGPKFLRPGALLGYGLVAALIILSYFYLFAFQVLLALIFTIFAITLAAIITFFGSHFHDKQKAQVVKLAEEQGITEKEAAARYKKSQRIGKIWRSFTGFSHLVWQLILTAKWKICPIIKFPDGS